MYCRVASGRGGPVLYAERIPTTRIQYSFRIHFETFEDLVKAFSSPCSQESWKNGHLVVKIIFLLLSIAFC